VQDSALGQAISEMRETQPTQAPLTGPRAFGLFRAVAIPTVMTKTELNGFRKALMSKQADLKNSIRGRDALVIDTSADELDRIQHGQERDFAMGNLARESKLLRQVEDALGRVDHATFGICAECEEDISSKRLAAVPWTDLCIRCQEASDSIRAGQPGIADEELSIAA